MRCGASKGAGGLDTCGLCWLQNWVIHRDLKPSNILVMGEGPEQVLESSPIWRLNAHPHMSHGRGSCVLV
jgi:serine/threonine protein kinase